MDSTNTPIADHFAEYLLECRYVKNLSPRTIESYEGCFRAVKPFLVQSEGDWPKAIMALAATGRRNPGGINIVVRAMKPFLRWLHDNGHASRLVKLAKQREPRLIIETLSEDHVKRLIGYKPTAPALRRIHTMAMLILDSGLRITEALTLRKEDVDMNNLLLKIMGKGSRERIVPFSHEMRKFLYQYMKQQKRTDSLYVFPSRSGTLLNYHNAMRDLHLMGKALKVTGLHFHLLRHTMATNYVRTGGDSFSLQRILGHSSITTTQKYVHLVTSDLQVTHDRHSALSKRAMTASR